MKRIFSLLIAMLLLIGFAQTSFAEPEARKAMIDAIISTAQELYDQASESNSNGRSIQAIFIFARKFVV